MTPRRLAILILFTLMAGLLAAPGAAYAEEGAAVDLETAERDLKILEGKLKKSRSINEEILAALDAVAHAYHNLAGPPKPEPAEIPDDASDEDKEALRRSNEALLEAWEVESAKFERDAAKFRRAAAKQFLRALKLQKINKNTDSNMREPVNVKAAILLGETGDPELSDDIIQALEKTIFKANYTVTVQLLEEVFAALAKLNNHDALEWMIEEFIHSKMSPAEEVERLTAAHKAMILFRDVPGRLRYDLVKEMQKTYGAVESQAKQSSSDPKIRVVKEFWDRIKTDVVKAVQFFAGNPKNEDEESLATMAEFVDWFRDHKNPKRSPWTDEE